MWASLLLNSWAKMNAYEALTIEYITTNISAVAPGHKRSHQDTDKLFSAFTMYVNSAINLGLEFRPVKLWTNTLHPFISQICAERGNDFLVHKGSPYYNVGLCYFLGGNFDEAYKWIAMAHKENEETRKQNGTSHNENKDYSLLTGDNSLSKQILIDPISQWDKICTDACGDGYKEWSEKITSVLGELDLFELVQWLAGPEEKRLDNAMQLLIALHRLKAAFEGPDNEASRRVAMQALANLVVLPESVLISYKFEGDNLQNRMEKFCRCCLGKCLFSKFKPCGSPYSVTLEDKPKWRECTQKIYTLENKNYTKQLICWSCVRARNDILHSLDDNLKISNSIEQIAEVARLFLGVLQILQSHLDNDENRLTTNTDSSASTTGQISQEPETTFWAPPGQNNRR